MLQLRTYVSIVVVQGDSASAGGPESHPSQVSPIACPGAAEADILILVGHVVEVVPARATVTLVRYTASYVGAQYPRMEHHLLWVLLA